MLEFEIRLEHVRFFARHGVFEHETRDGNEFEVNLSVICPADASEISEGEETLDSSISYVTLYEIVREEMEKPRQLLETVARAIGMKIKKEFPYSSRIECNISKLSPPIRGFIGEASVTFRID